MINLFEKLIADIADNLKCSTQEKQDISMELRDHLYSSYEAYIEQGMEEEQAVQLVLKQFGQSEHIAIQYQQSVNPLHGWLNTLMKILFMLYSIVLLFQLIISRLMFRIIDYVQADGPYSIRYVVSNTSFMTGKQFFNFSHWQHNLNLQPFETIIFYLTTDRLNPGIALNNLAGGIVLFIPLGFFLALLFIKFQKASFLLFTAFCISYCIEVLQFGLQIGTADIDDVILNMLGASIGYVIAKLIVKLNIWKINRTTATQ